MNTTAVAETAPSAQAETESVDWKSLITLAAQEVFGLMVGGDLVSAMNGGTGNSSGITAMLGLGGSPCAVFRVRCSWNAAGGIAARMLAASPQDLPPDQVCDAMGEICNMVAGSMKGRLADGGAACMMSVPSVVRGDDYEVRCLAGEPCHTVVLNFGDEPLLFQLNLQS